MSNRDAVEVRLAEDRGDDRLISTPSTMAVTIGAKYSAMMSADGKGDEVSLVDEVLELVEYVLHRHVSLWFGVPGRDSTTSVRVPSGCRRTVGDEPPSLTRTRRQGDRWRGISGRRVRFSRSWLRSTTSSSSDSAPAERSLPSSQPASSALRVAAVERATHRRRLSLDGLCAVEGAHRERTCRPHRPPRRRVRDRCRRTRHRPPSGLGADQVDPGRASPRPTILPIGSVSSASSSSKAPVASPDTAR